VVVVPAGPDDSVTVLVALLVLVGPDVVAVLVIAGAVTETRKKTAPIDGTMSNPAWGLTWALSLMDVDGLGPTVQVVIVSAEPSGNVMT